MLSALWNSLLMKDMENSREQGPGRDDSFRRTSGRLQIDVAGRAVSRDGMPGTDPELSQE
ncbi:hypothetical protein [Nocardia shimofusensis]|uniref:hypothetical protein n=1 Tax=Nocardia shimofusensis TaxID=228596 RepID=UPI00082C7CB8|nr:hypothetical protein [Nocardia shimofusensis]